MWVLRSYFAPVELAPGSFFWHAGCDAFNFFAGSFVRCESLARFAPVELAPGSFF